MALGFAAPDGSPLSSSITPGATVKCAARPSAKTLPSGRSFSDPAEKQGQGARFLSRFTKNRNASEDPVPLNWHFRPAGERVVPTFSEADPLQVFRGWVENGLTSCADIADEMNVSKGYVSKLAKRAENVGWLKIEKREYRIIGGTA